MTNEAIIPDDFEDLDMEDLDMPQDTTWPSEPVGTFDHSAPLIELAYGSETPGTSYITAEWMGSYELYNGTLFPKP